MGGSLIAPQATASYCENLAVMRPATNTQGSGPPPTHRMGRPLPDVAIAFGVLNQLERQGL